MTEEEWQQDRVGSALRGENPTVLRRMRSGFAVIGDTQFLPGYCVLLAEPEVEHLSSMDYVDRIEFLADMALLGEAVERACNDVQKGLARLNFEILGNGLPLVHAHVFPRCNWEDPERLRGPVWLYPPKEFYGPDHQLDERHDTLREAIAQALDDLMLAQDRVAALP